MQFEGDYARNKRNYSNDESVHGSHHEMEQPMKGQKYFTMLIGYPAMKRALKRKGWIEVGGGKKSKDYAGYTSSPNGRSSSNKHVLSREWESRLDLKFVLS